MEGGPGYHPASTQMEGGSSYHPTLKVLQDANHARAQLEILAYPRDTENWLKGTNISEPNRP